MDQGLATVVAAVAGAIAGGAGAVLAQVVSSRHAGRREERRFDWERDRASQLDQRERRRAFVEVRREAYVRLLSLLEERYGVYAALLTGVPGGGVDFEEAKRRVRESQDDYVRATREVVATIGLFAPRVEEAASHAASALTFDVNRTAEQLDVRLTSAMFYTRKLREAMRTDLDLDVSDESIGAEPTAP